MLNRATAWRVRFETLRQGFQKAADADSMLRHIVLQALADAWEMPPSLRRVMRNSGGYRAGELRARYPVPPPVQSKGTSSSPFQEFTALNSPAKIGYLYGPQKERKAFERLANQAWLALPGSPDGKAQAFPQPRPTERWLAFVYQTLRSNPGSYLQADDWLWVCWQTKGGRLQESKFRPERIRRETMVGMGYPQADQIPEPMRRWRFSALTTDVFTSSSVAIEMLLADPDPEGPFLISAEEMDAYQESPAFQDANFLVDEILLGEGRRFPICRYWCKPVAGEVPSICPSADPPTDEADRNALLEYLPMIAERFRQLGWVQKGQTVHWVGRQARLGTVCRCRGTVGTGKTRTIKSAIREVPARSNGEAPVVLRGRDEGPVVLGKEKGALTVRQYNVVKALLDARGRGLSKDKLDENSGHSEARKVLVALIASDTDWESVIHMPGKPGNGGYRIR
jgi:hypothetical protein